MFTPKCDKHLISQIKKITETKLYLHYFQKKSDNKELVL